MSDNKQYYYLKLKDNFFDSDAMIILESMPDGYLYSNILLKLYLRSLKFKGKLMYNEIIPYNSTVLAQVTRHNVGVVEKALHIFKELGLIEILDNGAIYMLDIQNFIGESSTEADRKREYRLRIEEEKEQLQLDVGQMSGQISDKSPPKIEIEIKKDLKKDIDIIMTPEEAKFISVLEKIKNYPINRKDDLDYMKTLEERYPALDMLEAVNKFSDYILDNPFKTKANHRSQLNTSFKKYVEWGICLKQEHDNVDLKENINKPQKSNYEGRGYK